MNKTVSIYSAILFGSFLKLQWSRVSNECAMVQQHSYATIWKFLFRHLIFLV